MNKKEIIELKQERAKILEDMRGLNKPEMNEDDKVTFANMDTRLDQLNETIGRAEKLYQEEQKFQHDFDGRVEIEKQGEEFAQLTADEKMEAIGAWFKFGNVDLSDKEIKLARRAGIDLTQGSNQPLQLFGTGDLRNLHKLHFAQSAIQGTAGGYTVPTTMEGNIEVAMLEQSDLRQVADIIRTASGNPLEWPTVDDTSNTASIVGENAARSTTDIVFDKKTWYSYTLSSDFVKVPVELLQDSIVNINQLVGELLGARLGRKANALYTTGTGAGQPQGIVTASVNGKTAASQTAVTLNEVHDLAHSVGTAYRRRGSYMMHPTVKKIIMQLTDGTGQYLWQPSVQLGEPDRFRGYPVLENEDMASSLTNAAKTIVFGDMSRFKIREVGTLLLSRANERFIDNHQVGFIAHIRVDSGILDAGQNPIKHLAQA